MIILRLGAVKLRMGHRSDASVYGLINAGLMTTGVAIGQRAKGWPDYEVDAINAARVAGKSDDEIRHLVVTLQRGRSDLAANCGGHSTDRNADHVEQLLSARVGRADDRGRGSWRTRRQAPESQPGAGEQAVAPPSGLGGHDHG